MAKGITLAPCGLIIERIEPDADALVIVARPTSGSAACPTCGHVSDNIQSRYQRLLSDLPSQGKPVRIKILARRFRCLVTDCRQRIFAERLDTAVARPFARRTSRLEGLVHHLGLALEQLFGFGRIIGMQHKEIFRPLTYHHRQTYFDL